MIGWKVIVLCWCILMLYGDGEITVRVQLVATAEEVIRDQASERSMMGLTELESHNLTVETRSDVLDDDRR